MLTPPAPLRRGMIRSTVQALNALPEDDPTRVLLEVQIESLQSGCPHENLSLQYFFKAGAVFCRDCFSSIPVLSDEEGG